MASDTRISDRDVFTLSANGATAGSYTTDGRWNRGGWATYPVTYPLRNEPEFGAKPYSPTFSDANRK